MPPRCRGRPTVPGRAHLSATNQPSCAGLPRSRNCSVGGSGAAVLKAGGAGAAGAAHAPLLSPRSGVPTRPRPARDPGRGSRRAPAPGGAQAAVRDRPPPARSTRSAWRVIISSGRGGPSRRPRHCCRSGPVASTRSRRRASGRLAGGTLPAGRARRRHVRLGRGPRGRAAGGGEHVVVPRSASRRAAPCERAYESTAHESPAASRSPRHHAGRERGRLPDGWASRISPCRRVRPPGSETVPRSASRGG